MKDEWRTPPEWIELFARCLGHIGLDPCYSYVQGVHYRPFAGLTWGKRNDALSRSSAEWSAHGPIYCNPPYSDVMPWVAALESVTQPWILLVNTSSSARWWHRAGEISDWMAFPKKRIAFIDPVTGRPSKGNRHALTIFGKGCLPGPLRGKCSVWRPARVY